MNKYLLIIMVVGAMAFNLGAMEQKPASEAEKAKPAATEKKKSAYQEWKESLGKDLEKEVTHETLVGLAKKHPDLFYGPNISLLSTKKTGESITFTSTPLITQKAEFKGVIKPHNFGSSTTQHCR